MYLFDAFGKRFYKFINCFLYKKEKLTKKKQKNKMTNFEILFTYVIINKSKFFSSLLEIK